MLTIILSLYIFMAYAVLSREFFSTWRDTLIAAFVLAVGEIIASEIILAYFSILQAAPLIVINLLPPTLILFLHANQLVPMKADLLRTLKSFIHVLLGSPTALWITALVVFAFIWGGWLVWVLPESSYDGLAYHLPIALSRLKFGDLTRLSGWPPWIPAYPECSELLMLWPLLLDHSLALVDGVQWPFWLLGLCATYGIARKMGAGPTASIRGSVIWALSPVVLLQARVAYNDLMVGALFLAAVNSLLASGRNFGVFIAGLAVALIAGIKYTGVLHPIVLGLGLVLLLWLREFRCLGWKNVLRQLVPFVVPVIIIGLPWYISNWVQYGNPFWPFTIVVGKPLFEGLFTLDWLYADVLAPEYRMLSPWVLNARIWMEPITTYSSDGRYGGLGMLWAVLGIPAFFYAFTVIPAKDRKLFLWLTLVLSGLYLLTPDHWWPRYVLFLPALGAVGAALTLQYASDNLQRLFCGVLCIGALLSLFLSAAPTSPADFIQAVQLPPESRPLLSLSTAPAYRWLADNTYSDTTVAYSYGLYFIAPLWGDDLHNRVVYGGKTPEEFAAVVAEGAVQFVFAERNDENLWLDSNRNLRKLYDDGKFSIYHVEVK